MLPLSAHVCIGLVVEYWPFVGACGRHNHSKLYHCVILLLCFSLFHPTPHSCIPPTHSLIYTGPFPYIHWPIPLYTLAHSLIYTGPFPYIHWPIPLYTLAHSLIYTGPFPYIHWPIPLLHWPNFNEFHKKSSKTSENQPLSTGQIGCTKLIDN